MPELTAEPLSPELILVSPPEEAALAREQLPDPPETLRTVVRSDVGGEQPSGEPSEATWNDFLADVRSRPVEPIVKPRPIPRPPTPVLGRGRKRLLVAAIALVAVGAVVGLGLARDRAQQKPASSAASRPVPSDRHVTTPKPAKHRRTASTPAVTTTPKPKSSKPSNRPRPKQTAGFVPTRVWSWAAAPNAGAYVVRFLRDGHKVLKVHTSAPRLVLPSRFNFSPGSYRWTVTVLPRRGKGAQVIVNSAFTVG
jgi:hypothetical protein